jgi:hypothetical protein
MAYAQPERDEDDAARVNASIINMLGITVSKMLALSLHKASPEGRFIEAMDTRLNVFRAMPTDAEVTRIKELAWKYRRQLPAHLAPKLPPNDPIVQEMESSR